MAQPTVKVESYEGAYSCGICYDSTCHDEDALTCSECTAQPVHRQCLEQAGLTACMQCKRDTVVPVTQLMQATSGDVIDLTANGDENVAEAGPQVPIIRPSYT